MKARLRQVAFILTLLLCSSPAYAQSNVIVRSRAGASAIHAACRLLGCDVVRSLNDPSGQLFLVSPPELIDPSAFLSLLTLAGGVEDAELDDVIRIVGPSMDDELLVPDGLTDTQPVNLEDDTVWNGYAAARWRPILNFFGDWTQTRESMHDCGVMLRG